MVLADDFSFGHMDGGAWWLMALIWILIVAVIAWAIVRAASSGKPGNRSSSTRPTAVELLAERYARGEIDTDEYRRRLEVLSE